MQPSDVTNLKMTELMYVSKSFTEQASGEANEYYFVKFAGQELETIDEQTAAELIETAKAVLNRRRA